MGDLTPPPEKSKVEERIKNKVSEVDAMEPVPGNSLWEPAPHQNLKLGKRIFHMTTEVEAEK